MRTTTRTGFTLGLVLVSCALPAGAQDAPKALTAAGQAATDGPAEKLDALVRRFNKERNDLIAAYQRATTDEEKKILAREGITWRQAIDGDTSGPWATKWNVNGWPTIYVLDAKGVIRYRDCATRRWRRPC